MSKQSYQPHDPDSITQLSISWRDWLPCGNNLASSEWECDGLTVSNQTRVGNTTSCRISGGTLHNIYRVFNTITTENGLVERQYIDVKVMEKPVDNV